MENDFKILRKNNFQPRILNLAELSSMRITIFSDVLGLGKADSCRAGIAFKQAKLELVRCSKKRLIQEEEIHIRGWKDWKEIYTTGKRIGKTKKVIISSRNTEDVCFNCLTSVGEGEMPILGLRDNWTHNTWHWADAINSSLYSKHGLGEEEGHHAPCRPHRGCAQEQREPPKAVGGSLYIIKRVKWPLGPWEDVISLFK